ncbi:hypothetical protein [Erythrobacter aureus]|uniref:hypothetical protein n=1 Tax=Erythrobacter aureus TaxID=2182384 RepID=UPI0013B46E14|nr:hypothetical protein [Erythrobacter aureus]
MKAYLVRLNSEQELSFEIVGFFFASDAEQLWRLVDECCEADDCEMLELEPGGIFWDQAVGYILPMPTSETAPPLPPNAQMTESWVAAVFGDGVWEKIPSPY